MLYLETKMNNGVVAKTFIRRIGKLGNPNAEYDYSIEYRREIDKKSREVFVFNVRHKRENGMEDLILRVYEEIDKRLKIGGTRKIL